MGGPHGRHGAGRSDGNSTGEAAGRQAETSPSNVGCGPTSMYVPTPASSSRATPSAIRTASRACLTQYPALGTRSGHGAPGSPGYGSRSRYVAGAPRGWAGRWRWWWQRTRARRPPSRHTPWRCSPGPHGLRCRTGTGGGTRRRRCCTRRCARTWPPSSRRLASTVAFLATSSRSSSTTWTAGCSREASAGFNVNRVATSCWWPSRASGAGCAPRAAPGERTTPPSTWWSACCPTCHTASGRCPSPGASAGTWPGISVSPRRCSTSSCAPSSASSGAAATSLASRGKALVLPRGARHWCCR